jgi:enediyne biosynthesis thioesterase
MLMNYFEITHTVLFEETNLLGNVYFSNYFKWQGECREMYIKNHAPQMIHDIYSGAVALITLHSSCDYFSELRAFDEVVIALTLDNISQNRIKLSFEYFRLNAEGVKSLIAAGKHEVGCFRKENEKLIPTHIHPALLIAIQK